MIHSVKSTDDFNDFLSYLGGTPLPPPRSKESSSSSSTPPARAAALATAPSARVVTKPAPVARRGSSNGSTKSNASSTLDEISVAHLHFNPKLRNSIRA
jgi:hypothetical protein